MDWGLPPRLSSLFCEFLMSVVTSCVGFELLVRTISSWFLTLHCLLMASRLISLAEDSWAEEVVERAMGNSCVTGACKDSIELLFLAA